MATANNQATNLVTIDAALAAELAALVNPSDTGSLKGPNIPKLKINNRAECGIPLGAWVVGQQIDQEGNVSEPGKQAKGLVIIAVRLQYSYYNHARREQNCTSTLFVEGQRGITGIKHKHICASKNDGVFSCPYRDRERNPHCGQQFVVYGVAITTDNQKIDCVAYVKGSSYMAFSNYLSDLVKIKTQNGYMEVPPFAFVTMLGAEVENKNGKSYYVSRFKRGQMIKSDALPHFVAKREEVYAFIERQNQALLNEPNENGNGRPVTQAQTAPPAIAAPPTVVEDDDEIPFDFAPSTPPAADARKTALPPPPKAATAPVATGDADFDIDAAISAVIGNK